MIVLLDFSISIVVICFSLDHNFFMIGIFCETKLTSIHYTNNDLNLLPFLNSNYNFILFWNKLISMHKFRIIYVEGHFLYLDDCAQNARSLVRCVLVEMQEFNDFKKTAIFAELSPFLFDDQTGYKC